MDAVRFLQPARPASFPVALVTPWFGPETRGGAEQQARRLSRALFEAGVDLEVWTTQGRDAFAPRLEPFYPAGRQEVDSVPVIRFPMDPPLLGIPPLLKVHARKLPPFPAHEINLLGSLPNSEALYRHILAHPERACIFIPYPMGMTFWGAMLAQGRAYLIPCLHDEPYARYSTYRYLFHHVERALFNSYPESELACKLYGLPAERCAVPGEGIELHWRGDGEAFRRRYGLEGDLLLYVGRRDVGKNVPLLLSYFREYRARSGQALTLVLIGPGELPVPPALRPWVRDLGFLPEQDKHDAYAAASILCQPSTIESFSIVVMESWLQGTPVLVNAGCPVTVDFCKRSGGGLWFDGFAEFAACLDYLLNRPELRRRMGEAGRAFVLRECRWDEVARRTIAAIQR